MSLGQVSSRYARAVLDFATENNVTDVVYNDMQDMVEVIDSSEDLRMLLSSPLIKLADKKMALYAIFSKNDSVSLKAIDLLIENKRIDILKDVSKRYIDLLDKSKGRQSASVTTATPLNDVLKEQVLAKIKELTGKQSTIKNIVDPSIIGGFILRVGDQQYDSSISNHFRKLRRQFN